MIIFARAPGTTGWVEIKPEEELSHRGQFWEIRKFAVESDDALPLARRLDRAEHALRAAGFKYHGPTEKWLPPTKVLTAPARSPDPRENVVRPFSFNWDGATDADFVSLLPGTYYMDPPDGGSVTVLEQFKRMARDASRYRMVRQEMFYNGGADPTPEEVDTLVDEHIVMRGAKS